MNSNRGFIVYIKSSSYFKLALVFSLLVLTLLSSSIVLAQVSQTNLDVGSSSEITSLLSKNYTLSNGGNTSNNHSLKYSTRHWAAFYGNVSGNIVLGDGSNDVVYSWIVDNFTDSVIYASTGTISDWSNTNIEAGTSSHQENFLLTNANDNFTNTFNESETFNSSSLNEANTLFSRTMQNAVEGSFKTYSLHAITEDVPLWAVKVREDDSSFIPGQTIDYQMIVPVTGTETYKFYLELY